MRVTLTLLRPGSNRVAWSRAYDGAFEDMFTLQNEAAVALSEVLQVTLTPEQRRRIESPGTTNVEAMADYSQGRAFLDRRDTVENLKHAATLLESAIRKDPRFARAHAALGEAYWRLSREGRDEVWADKALLQTMESLRLDPEDPSARYTLAVVYEGRGRQAEALEEVGRVLALQPVHDQAHNLLGQILVDKGRRDEGMVELRLASRLRPSYWGHHFELGVCFYDLGRYEEALAAFQRVAELQPDSSRGSLMLGTTYLAIGDTAAAITHLQHALAIEADSYAYTNLAAALSAAGRHGEAARAYEEAARLAPRSIGHQINLGYVYARLGDRVKAQKAFARATELGRAELSRKPDDIRALSMMALAEAKLGRHDEAIRHADEAVALAPAMGDVAFRRAVVLALTGRADHAVAALERALQLGYSRRMVTDPLFGGSLAPSAAAGITSTLSMVGATVSFIAKNGNASGFA